MRRRTFAKSPGLDRFLPFGLFAGQPVGLGFFALAVVLAMVTGARPGLVERERALLQNTLTPVLSAFSTPFATLSETFDYLYSLTRLKTEVDQLRVENKRLQEWYNSALLLQAENRSLRDLLKVKLDPALSYVTTRVVGDSGGPYAQTLMVGAGAKDGVRKGDPVLAGEGLIGRVMSVASESAVVLLITDINSHIPVRVEGSNLHAILAGTNGQGLALERFPDGSTVPNGARVLTSGVGGVFPPDLPVGQVEIGAMQITLKPYADLGRLLFVRIVKMPEYTPVEEPEADKTPAKASKKKTRAKAP